jgi:5-methylcytosine-specific restriction endonuclease McrA
LWVGRGIIDMPYNRKNVYYIEGEWGGKVCTVCGWFRNWWEFNKSKRDFNGYKSKCINCRHKNYLNHREEKLEYAEQYRINNKEKIAKKDKKYYIKNKEKIIEYKKQYQINNKDRIAEKKKEYQFSPSLYKTYGHQLTIEEDARETEDGYLEVRCATCKDYFIPANVYVQRRVQSLNGQQPGECKLYCSESCKENCSIYRQLVKPKGTPSPNTIKRSFPTEFRNMVLERDNHQCVICGSTDNLTVHHNDPFAVCKMFENDMDSAFTLCERCNTRAHSVTGCTLPELKKASQKMIQELKERGVDLNEVPEWAINKYIRNIN